MGFRCGVVGLPNVGKSTIFNALTSAGAQAANYPFCTIEANVGMVVVDDPRLAEINQFVPTKKIIPTTMEFVDIAGLVKGASQGQGLGNQFLARITEVQTIAHVVRCFDNPDVVHVDGSVDPARDIEVIQTELLLKDCEFVTKWLERSQRAAKGGGDPKLKEAIDQVTKLSKELNHGTPARKIPIEKDDEVRKTLNLITDKPVVYVANVGEKDLPSGNGYSKIVEEMSQKENARMVIISGGLEEEIAQLEVGERKEFLDSAGLKESGLNRLVKAGYDLLGLQTFFTYGPDEIRAWTISKGTKAPQAAGKIHSDFERGFISAEVIGFDDFIRSGGPENAKAGGKVRLEGKEYVFQDGDLVIYRFSV